MTEAQSTSGWSRGGPPKQDCYSTGFSPAALELIGREFAQSIDKLAASEGQALVSDARTDAPSGVPMSGGAEPAGAAKQPERDRSTNRG